MNTRKTLIWIVVMLMLVSLACSALQSTPAPTDTPRVVPPTNTPLPPPPSPTATPDQPPTPTITPEPEEPTASIEITNESGRDIAAVYISPTDAEDWGDNKLEMAVLADTASTTIAGIPEGTYDLQAVDADGNEIETIWESEISGNMTWTVQGAASLEIINASDEEIYWLYLSLSDQDTWGDDQLESGTIPIGESFTLTGFEAGTYDARVENADEELIESIYQLDLDDDYYWTVQGKASLPDGAVLRFEDDFADNRNSWGGTENDDARYNAPADGEYCIDIKVEQMTAWEWYEPFRPDEFVAEVACNVETTSDAACGLGFGPDGDNLYWFEVSPSDQSYALFKLQDDEWQDALVEWTVSKNIVPNGWNYLSVERVDGVLSVFINGVFQAEVDGKDFPTGRIGLGGSTYGDGGISICMDNLRVWRIE